MINPQNELIKWIESKFLFSDFSVRFSRNGEAIISLPQGVSLKIKYDGRTKRVYAI